MIASISGRVARTAPGRVVVEVGGLGYQVFVSLSTYVGLPGPGGQVSLRVVTVVREDEISLYGFLTVEEEDLFRLLQGVSGVGPRLALKILSGVAGPTPLRQALATGDQTLLTRVPGVGKKMAQRLIVELKEKVGLPDGVPASPPGAEGSARSEALEGLLALGYSRPVAERALDQPGADPKAPAEELVRQALRLLAPRR